MLNMRTTVAYFIDDRYLTSEQSQFVDLVYEDLKDFHDQASSEIVLLFPPVDSFLRLLIHKRVEEFHDLHSFSVGQGEGRQTVVCWKTACIESDNNQFGSVDRIGPWTMRGRGRARYRDQDSPNPGNCSGSGDRWKNDQYKSASPPPHVQSTYSDTHQHRNLPAQCVPGKHTYTSQERYTSDGLQDTNRTQSPSGGPSSSVRKNDRSKNRRPDVQVYVPRARRQQHGGQTDHPTSEPDRSPVVTNRSTHKSRQKKAEMERYVPRLPRIALQNHQDSNATSTTYHDSTTNAISTNHQDSITNTISTYDDSSGCTYTPDEHDPCDNIINTPDDLIHTDNYTRGMQATGDTMQCNQVVAPISDPNDTDGELKDSACLTDKQTSTNLGQQNKEQNTKEQTTKNLCKHSLEPNIDEISKSDDSATAAIDKISINASIVKPDSRTEDVVNVKDVCINKNLSLPPDRERTLCDELEHSVSDRAEPNKEPNAACDKLDQENSELVVDSDKNEDISSAEDGCIEVVKTLDVPIKQVYSIEICQDNNSDDICTDVGDTGTKTVVVDLVDLTIETLDEPHKPSQCDNESRLTQGSNSEDGQTDKSGSELVDSSVAERIHHDKEQTYLPNELNDLAVDKQPVLESESYKSNTCESVSENSHVSNSTSNLEEPNKIVKMTQDTIVVNNSADVKHEEEYTAETMETVEDDLEDELEDERTIDDCKDFNRTDEDDDNVIEVPTNEMLVQRGKVDSYVEDSNGFTEKMEMERNHDNTQFSESLIEASNEGKSKSSQSQSVTINSNQSETEEVDEDGKSSSSHSQSVAINSNQSETEEVDEDSWDAMFDDDGECLDPSAMDELTKTVGKVKIQKSKKINYLEYQPKDKSDFDYTQYDHIIEIYNFPAEFVTRDLIMAFQSFMSRGFDLKWVDDTHALGIFSSAIAAQDALGMVHPLLKVCPLSQASNQSKVKARRCTEFLQPYKPRPETSAAAARRLVAGALGLATNVSREKREAERQQLKEAKAKRRKDRQNRVDIWDFGGKCAMDEES